MRCGNLTASVCVKTKILHARKSFDGWKAAEYAYVQSICRTILLWLPTSSRFFKRLFICNEKEANYEIILRKPNWALND